MTRLLTPRLLALPISILIVATLLLFAVTVGPMQKAAASDPLLLPAVTYYSYAWESMSLRVADVNEDGMLDLLVAGYCDSPTCGVVSVRLGKSDGTFHRAVTYSPGGSYPRFITFADIDRDGHLDLVVANEQSPNDDVEGSVGVLKGNRNGTFRKAVMHDSGGLGPKSVAATDINNDGNPDLIVANTNNVAVLLGRGDGRFRSPITYDTGGNSIAVVDVNRDGNPDLVIAGDSLFLRLGNGDGTFQEKQSLGAGGSFVAAGDLDRDGNPDLIVSNYADSTVSVLLSNGDGTFQPRVVYPSGGESATSVAVGDINRDGSQDVLVTNICAHSPCPDGGPGQLGLLLGNRDGSLQPALTYATGATEARSVAVGDIDGDGKLDAVVANRGGTVGVLLNNIPPRASTVTTLVGDINPSNLNQTVTFSSTVKSDDGRDVSGTLTFWNRGKKMGVVGLSSGYATFQWAFNSGGHHPITAVYSGDFDNLSSVSPTWVQNAKPFPVPTKVHVTSSANPSHAGQPVTFTATVTNNWGTIPDGELVTFVDVSTRTTLGTAPLVSATASITTSLTVVRTHTIRATYAGDPTYHKRSGHVEQVVTE